VMLRRSPGKRRFMRIPSSIAVDAAALRDRLEKRERDVGDGALFERLRRLDEGLLREILGLLPARASAEPVQQFGLMTDERLGKRTGMTGSRPDRSRFQPTSPLRTRVKRCANVAQSAYGVAAPEVLGPQAEDLVRNAQTQRCAKFGTVTGSAIENDLPSRSSTL
jgi:hypothetical protein